MGFYMGLSSFPPCRTCGRGREGFLLSILGGLNEHKANE